MILRRMIGGGALLAGAAFGMAASAQAVQTYRYDAHGRLAASVTARQGVDGSYAFYALDAADNRQGLNANSYSPPPTPTLLEWPYQIAPTQGINSPNGVYRLELAPSGGLRMVGSGATWACPANGKGLLARVDADGRLTVLGPDGTVIWTSPSATSPGARLTVTNAGVAELRDAAGNWLWDTSTPCV